MKRALASLIVMSIALLWVQSKAQDSIAMDSLLNEDYIRSMRDPFQIPTIISTQKEVPKTDLELYQLKDFRLNGVITGPKKMRAMITAPNGKTYFVTVGDRIGIREGKVAMVLPDAIRVNEFDIDETGKRLVDPFEIRLSGDVVSLSNRETRP